MPPKGFSIISHAVILGNNHLKAINEITVWCKGKTRVFGCSVLGEVRRSIYPLNGCFKQCVAKQLEYVHQDIGVTNYKRYPFF